MEDVSMMKTQESYLFMVDSRMRDKNAHPTASEYTIEFQTPFRNVCSFGLLDATIPRTHYNIDEGYNTLVYSLDDDEEVFTATVPPGDYNLLQLTDTLNQLLLGSLQIEPYTVPFDLTNKARFVRSRRNYTLYMASSGLRTALGFEATTYRGTAETQTSPAFAGPLPETTTTLLSTTTWLCQSFVAATSGVVSSITVACDPPGCTPTLGLSVVLKDALQEVVATGTVRPSRSSTAILDAGAGTVVAGERYILYIHANEVTTAYVAQATTGETTYQVSANSGLTWTYGTNGYQLCVDVTTTLADPLYRVSSPNLVDLTGEKAVLIRCPEIEQVLFRERFTEQKVHAGLGYVKLGTLGDNEHRNDYVIPFPPRTFHPIAKVSRLTIRLETPDGRSYNTRGVDHLMLFMIAYYKVNYEAHPPSLLNPAYTPDAHSLLQQKLRSEAVPFSAYSGRKSGGRG